MRNTVSPSLNDTEHQLLQDNSGKQLVRRCDAYKSIFRSTESKPRRERGADTVETGWAILDAGKSSFISHRDSVVFGCMTRIQSILTAWIDMKNTLLNHERTRTVVVQLQGRRLLEFLRCMPARNIQSLRLTRCGKLKFTHNSLELKICSLLDRRSVFASTQRWTPC